MRNKIERNEKIAAEHCRWARRAGMTPAEVIRSVGGRKYDLPRWEHAVLEVARAADRLRREMKKTRADDDDLISH